MDRRKFLKASLCAGCVAALGGGCFFSNNKNDLPQNPWDKFKYTDVSQLPTKVRIDACNDCQLNCARCWIRTYDVDEFNKVGGFGYLKFEDFKNFIEKHSFIKDIEISNNGEIFLNPELDDIIKYAYEKGIRLTANNGVNLNTVSDETLENLVKYQFSELSVSIDGATPEVYSIYRRGGDFNTVIANIEKINKFKEQYNSEYPYMYWQFILFGHNEHEIDAAKEYAKKLNMEIVFIKNLAEDYSPLKDVKMVEEKTGLKFPEYENRDNSYSSDSENGNKMSAAKIKYIVPEKAEVAGTVDVPETIESEHSKPEEISKDDILCYQLVEEPQINFNGDLLGCCVTAQENFGANVFKEGLLNALNSDKMLRAKLMLTDMSVETYNDLPCRWCGVYLFLLKEKGYPLKFPEFS